MSLLNTFRNFRSLDTRLIFRALQIVLVDRLTSAPSFIYNEEHVKKNNLFFKMNTFAYACVISYKQSAKMHLS